MLLEREQELDEVERLLAAARDGNGGALLIEGPPGIGKSSLLGAARERAGDLRVLTARGGELERELPFGVVRQLLEPAAGDELLTGAAALAAPVLRGDGTAAEFAALHGLYWLTVNLAPLVAVVDDVHWCDAASLRRQPARRHDRRDGGQR